MEKLYFFVPIEDPENLLFNYFIDGGAFGRCLIIALLAAIAGAAIFYGIFGMKSQALSSVPVWIITLVVVGLATLGITHVAIVGNENPPTGLYVSMQNQLVKAEGTQNFDKKKTAKENIETNLRGDDRSLVYALDCGNMIYSILLFFIISLGVKRLTIHAAAIPFAKP